MKLAICDDERPAREQNITLVEDYMHDKKKEFEYEEFESYSELLPRIDEFDLFLMDYEVPEMNGMEFATKLREEYGLSKQIIFISSYENIVFETIKVATFRFIRKSLNPDDFKESFYEAFDGYFATNKITQRVTIKCDGLTEVIDVKDILYIESDKKFVIYCLADGSRLSCRKTMDAAEEEMVDYGFFRIHKRYIVNLANIGTYINDYVVLKNEEMIDMSPKRFTEFKKTYNEWKMRT